MNFKYWFSNFSFVPFKHWYKMTLCLIGKHDWPVFQYGKYDTELNQSHYLVTCAYCNAVIKKGIEQ